MDLATAKQKLNEYTSVEEALQDLRLIWENCRTFNAEGSDILLSAEACAEMLEALVEVSILITIWLTDHDSAYGHERRNSSDICVSCRSCVPQL